MRAPVAGPRQPDGTQLVLLTAVLRWSLVVLFVAVGGAKLVGVTAAVALFDAVGFGHWFRYVVGATEVLGATLLARTSTIMAGVIVLVFLMAGALGTEVLVLHRVPFSSLAALIALGVLVHWLRLTKSA